MNLVTFGNVQRIAEETRIWTEVKAKQSKYNAEDLTGWCAIASAELHKRLTAEGIESTIHMHDDEGGWGCHCFCVVEDHVVDVTATQFFQYRSKPVVILHTKEAEVNDYHRGTKIFSTAKDLRKDQKRTRWPSNQIAFA